MSQHTIEQISNKPTNVAFIFKFTVCFTACSEFPALVFIKLFSDSSGFNIFLQRNAHMLYMPIRMAVVKTDLWDDAT